MNPPNERRRGKLIEGNAASSQEIDELKTKIQDMLGCFQAIQIPVPKRLIRLLLGIVLFRIDILSRSSVNLTA